MKWSSFNVSVNNSRFAAELESFQKTRFKMSRLTLPAADEEKFMAQNTSARSRSFFEKTENTQNTQNTQDTQRGYIEYTEYTNHPE